MSTMSVSRNIASYMLVYIARFLYLAYSSYGWRWCSQNFVTIYGTKNQSNKLTQCRNVSEVMNVWAIEILLLLLLLLLPFGSGQPKAKSRKNYALSQKTDPWDYPKTSPKQTGYPRFLAEMVVIHSPSDCRWKYDASPEPRVRFQ